MFSGRRFKRYQVGHCDFFGGNITESDYELKLATVGLGGCGFLGITTDPNLVPPKEIMCSFFTKLGVEFKKSQLVPGNIIYVSPSNLKPYIALYYGIKFHEEERAKMAPLIKDLELWDQKGYLK